MRRTRSKKGGSNGTRKGGMFKIGNTGVSFGRRGFRPSSSSWSSLPPDAAATPAWFWVAAIFFILLSNMVGQDVKISQALNYAAENGITNAVNVVPLDYRTFPNRVLGYGKSGVVKLTPDSLDEAIKYYNVAPGKIKKQINEKVEELLKKNGSSSRRSSKSSSRKSSSQA